MGVVFAELCLVAFRDIAEALNGFARTSVTGQFKFVVRETIPATASSLPPFHNNVSTSAIFNERWLEHFTD